MRRTAGSPYMRSAPSIRAATVYSTISGAWFAEAARLVHLATTRTRRQCRGGDLVVDATKKLQIHDSEANDSLPVLHAA